MHHIWSPHNPILRIVIEPYCSSAGLEVLLPRISLATARDHSLADLQARTPTLIAAPSETQNQYGS
jgi:hypothetical protein